MASLVSETGLYAEEVDRRLGDIAQAARLGEGARTDAELRDWQSFAKGLESAREVLREVLYDPEQRAVRAVLVQAK